MRENYHCLEVALQLLLGGQGGLGDPIEAGISGLTHLPPLARQVAGTGVQQRRAETIAKLARAEPGSDVAETRRALSRPDAFYTQDRARH